MNVYTIRQDNRGFTLIELMIATAIFSFILLIATAGIIKIGQMYYKGVTESKVQNTVRGVSDELSRSIQFAKGVKVDHPDNTTDLVTDPVKRFCLGDYRYTAYIDKPFVSAANPANNTPTANRTGMWMERLTSGSSCACSGTCVQEGKQLLGVNTRVLTLNVTNLGAGIDKAWNVDLRLAYGDSDLLDHYNNQGLLIDTGTAQQRADRRNSANCKSGVSGNSFCAVAQLDTVVKKRLN